MTIQRILIFLTSLIFAFALAALFTTDLGLSLILGGGAAFTTWLVVCWEPKALEKSDGSTRRARTRCDHPSLEPVTTLDGELVAYLCTTCDTQLYADDAATPQDPKPSSQPTKDGRPIVRVKPLDRPPKTRRRGAVIHLLDDSGRPLGPGFHELNWRPDLGGLLVGRRGAARYIVDEKGQQASRRYHEFMMVQGELYGRFGPVTKKVNVSEEK